ncbi:hypothetical protein RRF57_007942 [Xylaria bambusicola]|uniref:Uncharacterized protein n=1 Tax=Xylaria bambusicola TaxID=326684 RepID=A0AAN7ZB34_9PEZI
MFREPRATTPSYATPHSNAPFVDTRPGRGDVNIFEDDDDIDFDINVADSGSDADIYDDDNDDEESGSELDGDDNSMADLGHDSYQTQSQESWQDGQAPEDEVWRGCEDIENHNPDVNIHVDDDAMTDADADAHETQSQGSSAPSEYPSTQPPWVTSGREQEFRVFEDK